MAVPESHGSGENPGLFVSLRSFWGVLLAIFYTRLDLLSAELEEEATRAVKLIIVSLAAMASIGVTVLFLTLLFIASFWDGPHRLLILGIVVAFYALASLVFILIARTLLLERPKFLEQTLSELRRDVEGLRTTTVKSDEPKS